MQCTDRSRLWIASCCLALVSACTEPSTLIEPVWLAAVIPGTDTIVVPSHTQLSAFLTDANGNRLTDRRVFWVSEDPRVATVSPTGVVTGLTSGTVTITATSEQVQGTAKISVWDPLLATSVSASGGNSCAVDPQSRGFCWGGVATRVGENIAFKTIIGLVDHTCGLDLAGHAYCWGSNWRGQLGDGTTTNRPVPTPVASGVYSELSGGETFTCGTVPGEAPSCWGRGFGLQYRKTSYGLDRIYGGYFSHRCGLTSNGSASCWGNNYSGQLGDGTFAYRNSPAPVAGGHRFVSMTLGEDHTCAITVPGWLYCWGRNDYGQVGDGTTLNRSTPTPVAPTRTFTSVTAGLRHTCAVTTTQAAYCWGWNGTGAVGDGSVIERHLPTAVSGALRFVALSAGAGHNCGLTDAGWVYCWGSNTGGQLGINSDADQAEVPGPALLYTDEW